MAVVDYANAVRSPVLCASLCFRAIEAIKSAFGPGNEAEQWACMHATLGTSRTSIDDDVKAYADPIRHGDWSNFRATNIRQRDCRGVRPPDPRAVAALATGPDDLRARLPRVYPVLSRIRPADLPSVLRDDWPWVIAQIPSVRPAFADGRRPGRSSTPASSQCGRLCG
jgi:hypothetical protein